MATGKHKAVLDGVVAAIAAIDGTGDYNYDWRGTDQVSTSYLPERTGDFDIAAWVRPGNTSWEDGDTSPPSFEVFLEVAVQMMLAYYDEGSTLVDALELGRYDLLKAILESPNLGGQCTYIRPLRAGEMAIDKDQRRAVMDVVFIARLSDVQMGNL